MYMRISSIIQPLFPQMVQAVYGLRINVTISFDVKRAIRRKPVPVGQQLMPVCQNLILLCIMIFLLI